MANAPTNAPAPAPAPEATQTPPAPKVETPPSPPQTYKVKVDGQEREVGIDDLLKNYSLGTAAQQRIQQATEAKNQILQLINLAKTNPKEFFSHPAIGVDLKEFIQRELEQQVQNEMMDPKDRALKEKEAELERFRQEQQKAEEQAKQTALQQRAQMLAETMTKDIVSALENVGVPKTSYTVRQLAYYWQQARKQGYELPLEHYASFVKRDYINQMKELFGSSDEDTLADILGDEFLSKSAKAHLKRLEKNSARPDGKAPTSRKAPVQEKVDGTTPQERMNKRAAELQKVWEAQKAQEAKQAARKK